MRRYIIKRNSVSAALIELRKLLGRTQQQFASDLNMSIASIARHETCRPPQGKILLEYARLAELHAESIEDTSDLLFELLTRAADNLRALAHKDFYGEDERKKAIDARVRMTLKSSYGLKT